MPEIHNPQSHAYESGRNGLLSVTTFAILALIFLIGYQYRSQPAPIKPEPAGQAQPGPNTASFLASQAQSSKALPDSSLAHKPRAAVEIHTPSTTASSHERQEEFGWLTVIAKPLYLALRFIYEHGVGNWGWAIIVLTTIFNLLMLWPRTMSMRSSLKMMRLQPKVQALKQRYAHLKINDPKRAEMNVEMMALYKVEGVSLYGGCLPLLLQSPLLFAYASVLRNAVELRQAHWLWITDLSQPDPLHVLPILIIVTMALTQFITPTPTMDPTQRRILAFVMPAIMGLTLWHYASGLGLYWATGNIVNLMIQLAINRSKIGMEMAGGPHLNK
jgi:YidC/Oxa1 family membrane protein insertase